MDRADQIAEKIYLGLVMWISADVDREWRQNILIGIAAALREYSREQDYDVMEAAHLAAKIDDSIRQKVRNEALDEAAKVANITWSNSDGNVEIVKAINALKTPPSEGEKHAAD